MSVAYTNALLYDTDAQTFFHGTLVVEKGRIAEITASDRCSDDAVDLHGAYVIPGLVDIHTHGRAGYDFTSAGEDALTTMLRSYAKAGTTSVMATFASAEMADYEAAIDRINRKRDTCASNEASLVGFHLEGRYLNPGKRGAHAARLLALPNLHELERLMTRMRRLPIHISTAPEMENGERFIRRAVELGATVSIGHSNTTYDEAVEAIGWGASSFTHLYNAMREIHHREPGNAVAGLLSDTAYVELICDGLHIAPPMIELAHRAKPADKVVLITDSMEAAGCSDGNYAIAGTKVVVKDGLALNEEGRIAGSTLSLFRGMCNYAKFCKIRLEDAIPAATINPATLIFGDTPDIGALKRGNRADFIVMESLETPEVNDVYLAGVRVAD